MTLPRHPSLLLIAALLVPTLARSDSPITKTLQPYVESHSLAGAVTVVATKNTVLARDTVGFADVAGQKPMKPDTMFWIASMTKPITAAAFMMLVDEGKVKIEDPVEKYLPEFKDLWVAAEQDKDRMVLRRPAHPITVGEILSHTSGLAFKSAIEQPTLDLVPLRTAVLSHTIAPLLFEPGTKYLYSNSGINTAGRIIEVLSEMSYEEFMQKRLFDPVGMKDATFFPTAQQVTRLAKSYKPNANKNGLEETPITYLSYPLTDKQRQVMPGGGLFATADDVARFCQMILCGGVAGGKRLLSEESIKLMTSRHTAPSMPKGYGLGWMTDEETFGHGGAYATNMTIHPKRGLITIFMVQHAGFPGKGAESGVAFKKAAIENFGR